MTTPKKKRRMAEFAIHEISAVDDPAQAHAQIVLMKRDTAGSIAKMYIDPMQGAMTFGQVLEADLKEDGNYAAVETVRPYINAMETSLKSIAGDSSLDTEKKLTMMRATVNTFLEMMQTKVGDDISISDMAAQVSMGAGTEKNSTRKEFKKMQTEIHSDDFMVLAKTIAQRDGCTVTEGMRKARREGSHLFAESRIPEVEKQEPICGAVRKSADEIQFESLVKQIASAEKVKPTDAMIIARKRYPSEFAKAYG